MDDDEKFRTDLISAIEDNDTVNYKTVFVETEVNTVVYVDLYAGDRFKITIEEL